MAQQNNIQVGLEIRADVLGENEIKQLSQTLNSTATATDHLGDEAQILTQKLEQARAESARLKQVWAQDKDNEQARMAYVRQGRAVQQLERELASLAANGSRHHTSLAAAAQGHGQKLNQIEQSLRQVRPSLDSVMTGLGGMMSAGGGLAYVTNEAIKFESAMAQVKKVTDATPEQIAKLSGSLKELGGELGMLPDELAQIAAAGGQMGIAFEKLPEFTKMTAQMANAFGITADAAGDMSAKISNVYGLTIDEMRELGDAINTLGNTTAAKEAEIGNVLMRIGGNAKQFGLLKEEAAALSAAFVSLGKSPEEAGTAINAMLTKLQTSTEQTNEFKDSLKDIGLSAEEMAANIAANPQAALTDFLQRIEKLDKQSRSITLSKMFGAEYSDDLALLSGSLKTYEEALANATDRTKTFGAMQREAEAALNTTKGKMKQAKADIAAAAIELGNALLPAVQAAALGLGTVADAVTSISQQFPVLSQLAVLFAGAKLASMALGSAMRVAGVDGAASLLKADVGATKLKVSLLETAAAAKAVGVNLRASMAGNLNAIDDMGNNVRTLGGKMAGAAQNAASFWAAFEGGKAVGTMLREQFDFVRDLGDEMSKPLAMLHSLLETGSLEQYNREFRTTNELARELEQNQKAAAKAAKARQEADKKAAEQKQAELTALRNQYAENQRQYDAVSNSMKVMAERGQQGSQAYQALSEKQAKLAGELMQNQLQLEQFGDKSADGAAKTQAALSGLGLTAEQLSGELSENAQRILTDFGTAAKSVGNDADQMAVLFQAAAQKLDAPEALAALKQNFMEAAHKAGLTVEQMNKIIATAPQVGQGLAAVSKPLGDAEKAANALGVSLDNALVAGTGSAMSAALVHFDKIKSQLDGLQQNGINTGIVLRESLSKLTDTAQSESDINALKQEITQLGATGKLSMQDVERAILAADQKLNELRANTDPTAQAFERLGIKTKEAMRLSAEQMRQDFEAVEQSGEAVSGSLKDKFAQVAAEMLASGNAQQQAWVQSKAAAYDYKVTIDSTGKASLQAANETVQAAATQTAAHQQVAAAAKQAAAAQVDSQTQVADATEKTAESTQSVARKVSELGHTIATLFKRSAGGISGYLQAYGAAKRAHHDLNKQMRELNDSTETGINLSDNLAKMQGLVSRHADALNKTSLSKFHAAIDKARQKLRQMADEAANTKKALEKQLLNAQGNASAVAEMEQREAIDALQKQLDAAKKMGNDKAAADYQQSIELQKRIYETELNRQRAEAEQAKREAAEAEAAEIKAKQDAERAQREQAQRESTSRVQNITLPEFKLPEPQLDLSAIDLSNVQIDTSAISDALAQRDSANLAQIKEQLPQLINDLIPQIAQKLIEQMQKDFKRGI